jgi:hypothetical protein
MFICQDWEEITVKKFLVKYPKRNMGLNNIFKTQKR